MEKLALALAALTLSAPAIAVAPDKGLAPPVTRIPSQARQACDPGSAACPQSNSAAGSAQRYRSALAGARPAEDPELNSGAARVMSDLMAAGRCGDAVALAKREGRSELAARAQELCK